MNRRHVPFVTLSVSQTTKWMQSWPLWTCHYSVINLFHNLLLSASQTDWRVRSDLKHWWNESGNHNVDLRMLEGCMFWIESLKWPSSPRIQWSKPPYWLKDMRLTTRQKEWNMKAMREKYKIYCEQYTLQGFQNIHMWNTTFTVMTLTPNPKFIITVVKRDIIVLFFRATFYQIILTCPQ